MTQPSALHFRILGPLEVLRDGRVCTPNANKQRRILALLLLHANDFVPTDRIVDELWDGTPPRSARAALQGYVSALRRMLTPGSSGAAQNHPVLGTRPNGYRLELDTNQLDLKRYRVLTAAGRAELAAGRCGRAWQYFDDARELWRGSPLADLGCTITMSGHVARLEEEHLALMQDWAAALLGRGAGAQAVPELENLCSRYPLRETLHHHLLVALYQADRRADALAAYARAYRLLASEAGIEPGPRLQAAHQAVLQQRDPLAASRD